jgi:precorrin-6A/cobalt-precorrin-6A reductase
MTRILLLGGTTEASAMATALHAAGVQAEFSYAGRTAAPVTQPLPTRIGGFGGVDGLVEYIRAHAISHVIDATHPFAAQISRNAIAACNATQVPLIVLQRAAWIAGAQDRWVHVADTLAAVAALPDAPARVFLAIGKQTLEPFTVKPQHHYLLRLVDVPEGPLPLPDCAVVIARGPFTEAGDTDLMTEHGITHIVAKNSGGTGAQAKLAAARARHLPVILIERPALPPRQIVHEVTQVMEWLHQSARLGV